MRLIDLTESEDPFAPVLAAGFIEVTSKQRAKYGSRAFQLPPHMRGGTRPEVFVAQHVRDGMVAKLKRTRPGRRIGPDYVIGENMPVQAVVDKLIKIADGRRRDPEELQRVIGLVRSAGFEVLPRHDDRYDAKTAVAARIERPERIEGDHYRSTRGLLVMLKITTWKGNATGHLELWFDDTKMHMIGRREQLTVKGGLEEVARKLLAAFKPHWAENTRAKLQWVYDNHPNVWDRQFMIGRPNNLDRMVADIAAK
jgi:hypothetical protein